MSEVLAWHWTADTLRDGRPIPPVGEVLRHDGPLILCESGLHASERLLDSARYAPGNHIHRVRCGGEMMRERDKLVCRERTILWSHTVSTGLLRGFARAQARSVLHLWDAPQVVRDYLETGDEALRAAALEAASRAAEAAEAAEAWAAAQAAEAAEAAAGWAAIAKVETGAEALARADAELTALILSEAGRTEP